MTARRLATSLNAVLALTLLGCLLRFATLDLRGFWVDEGATVLIMRHDLPGVFSEIERDEAAPPLYYVLAWFWTRVFGDGEVGLRSLSALAGTATIPLAYLAARELVSRRAGVAAAALVAVNPLLIWYSQEARVYALTALFGVASFYFFARSLRRPTTWSLALWAVTSALAIGTHYFAVFAVVAEGLWLLAGPSRRAAAVASAAVVLAGIPLLPLALAQADFRVSWIDDTGLIQRLRLTVKHFFVAYETSNSALLGWLCLALAMVGVILVLIRGSGSERFGALMAATVAAAAFAGPVLLAFAGKDYVLERNLLTAFFPAAVLVAAGLGARRAGVVGPAVAAALCALSVAIVVSTASTPKFGVDDWRRSVEDLGPPSGPRAVVATPWIAGETPLKIYLDGARRLPRAGARVREVALITMARDDPNVGGHTPRPSPAPPAGFRSVERVERSRFTLIRFEAPRPIRVTRESLRPLARGTGGPVVLLQPASGSRSDS